MKYEYTKGLMVKRTKSKQLGAMLERAGWVKRPIIILASSKEK